ncbi:MAG: PqqD family peptide modification chaperone [Acidobacteria bacterium]|nr:PqqD family peptide modification chaperone [Acidobacteriota bacterium]
MTTEEIKPQARSEGLVIQELADEVLVYDLQRDKAHCLNRTAALVWQHSDGQNSIAEIAAQVGQKTGAAVDEALVWLALEQLSKAHLLPAIVKAEVGKKSLTRREVIRRLGIGAAVAIPIVTSIVAPLAVQAATCLGAGSPCSSGAECCSGLCSGTCVGGRPGGNI